MTFPENVVTNERRFLYAYNIYPRVLVIKKMIRIKYYIIDGTIP